MTEPNGLALSGALGGDNLLNALRAAAQLNTYATVQIAGAPTSGEMHLANGEILITDAADPAQRQQAFATIFGLIQASQTESGAFRFVPLSNVSHADSVPRIQVAAAISSASQGANQPAPTAPAAAPVAAAPAATSAPTPAAEPIASPAPSPAVAPVPAPSPIHASTAPPAAPERRIRASQLRKLLREGGSINDHLPQTPEVASTAPSRSSALRELIGQLATD